MPIPQTIRVNPLDLQKNIAIGVSLPFNGPAGPFNSTYSTKIQTKSNIINLLLTSPGERLMNPEFGSILKKLVFENSSDKNDILIQQGIKESVELYIPNVQITDIIINKDLEENNTLQITVNYKLKISQEADQVTLQLI